MACRVMDIDYGKSSAGQVLLTLVEDIFGLEEGEFGTPSGSLWTDIPDDPVPFVSTAYLSSPYPALVRAGLSGTAYPGVYVGVMAREEQAAMSSFVLTTEVVRADGSLAQRDYSGQITTPMTAITTALVQEATSSLTDAELGTFSEGYSPSVGDVLYASGTGDADSEFMLLTAHSAGVWTVARGLYDTIPHDWPLGTFLWSADNIGSSDPNVRTPGADVSYWLRPKTLAGTLDISAATEDIFTPTERPHLPFRPTNVKIEGVSGFGTYTYVVLPADISVSWSNRNRTMEDTVALHWTDATTTGETGQTTTIRVRDTVGSIIAEYPDLPGTSYDIPVADVVSYSSIAHVEVISVRDGLESLQYQSRMIELPAEGYGIGYGIYYG
jgi:hypothetical protein